MINKNELAIRAAAFDLGYTRKTTIVDIQYYMWWDQLFKQAEYYGADNIDKYAVGQALWSMDAHQVDKALAYFTGESDD